MSANRYALIIASDQYEDTGLRRLIAPSHDAEALASALRDPAVGDFDAEVIVNQSSQQVRRRIEAFFRDRRRDDLLLLYFSGHGLKDETGRLFLAMTDTERQLLNATAVPARFVHDAIEQTRSLRTVLLLDCCYGGAFARALSSKGGPSLHLNDRFGATGSVLLTSSNEMEYAFEDEKLVGTATASVFTRILVEGLRSGDADANGDGYIDVDELYDYVRDRMINECPEQRPNRWDLGVDGRILVARNPNWQLPQIILDEMANPMSVYRARAVEDLVELCRHGNEFVQARVREALLELAEDDSKQVSGTAETALTQLFPSDGVDHGSVSDPKAQPIPTAVNVRSPSPPTPAPPTAAPTSSSSQRRARSRLARTALAVSAAVVVVAAVIYAIAASRGATANSGHFTTTSISATSGQATKTSPSPSHSESSPASSSASILPAVAVPHIDHSVKLEFAPNYLAASPNGHQLYIAGANSSVAVFDITADKVTADVSVPGPAQFLCFSPDGRYVYVSLWDKLGGRIHEVSIVDTRDNSVKASIQVDTRPYLAAVSPDGKWLYVPNHDTASISVIDTATDRIVHKISVPPNPHYVSFSTDGRRAYVADHESNVITVIDTGSLKIVTEVRVGTAPHSVEQNPNRPEVMNVNWKAHSVSVIDTNSNAVIKTVDVGDSPLNIQWSRDGRFAYVVNNGSNDLSVISADSWRVTEVLPTGRQPTATAVLPDGSKGYVSNSGDRTLTVLDLA